MGYDFDAGRQDISTHPFTTNFATTDVRVTTRINEKDMTDCLFSAIHEGGHALYEQGLLTSNYGLPLGEAASLSVHESQSRLWENNVGRHFLSGNTILEFCKRRSLRSFQPFHTIHFTKLSIL